MGECAVCGSLTAVLRAATQSAHQLLDSQPILIVLKAFERVWRSLEPNGWAALRDRMPAVAPLEAPRSGILAADILALTGASPATASAAALATFEAVSDALKAEAQNAR
jgi:hypothetical protein